MKLSVALATFNAERFLSEQLRSIAEQTRLPDELVVCDNSSEDRTVELLQAFAASAPFQVRVEQNAENLGATGNFGRAISLCSGEVIACCDADDVWLPQKLDRIEAAFATNPGAGMVFSDAAIVDQDLRAADHTMWDAIEFHPALRRQFSQGRAFDVLMQRWVVQGAAMAFRSDFRPLVLPIPRQWVHDGWIALLIASRAAIVPIEEPLLMYRQHLGQLLGGAKLSFRQQYAKAKTMQWEWFAHNLSLFEAALDRLSSQPADGMRGDVLELLSAKVAHCQARLAMRERSNLARLPLIARELASGRYRRFASTWKAIPQDLLL